MHKIILFPLFSLMYLVNIHAQQSNKILPNGIQLPSIWPPRYEEPIKRQGMKLPYLKDKPKVISIDIGRQLFVDSFLIAKTNLEPVYHKPIYYSQNPVLTPTKEWEKALSSDSSSYAAPFSDGIWYDEKDNKYKMWYLAGGKYVHNLKEQSMYTCYAESKDGKEWEKVVQDIIPNTNIVDTMNRDAATLWIDKMEKDSNKRYKFFNVEKRPADKRWQMVLKYSADGIHWSKGVAQSGDIYDRSTAFYNPFTQKWALSMRYGTSVSSRSRAYLENEDPELAISLAHRIRKDVEDKNVVFWFTPDDKEPIHPKFPTVSPGIYNFDAIPYESIMVGLYSVWEGPENGECRKLGIQKRNEILLGYSRDGFHFSRPDHTPFMGVNEVDESWNWGNMQSINGVPLIVGDSLYFYASGRRLNQDTIFWDTYTATGLATLRRDGFVSMHATNKEGYLLTEPLKFDGDYFFVNADVKNNLQVEIQDQNGNVLSGFSRKDSKHFKGNSTKKMMVWKEYNNLKSIKGKIIRLKFYLTDGDIYSFWISTWQTGESKGYTAGGGPGLNAEGIDKP